MSNTIAPAKINLSLHVEGQREDGYHILSSLVAFASTGDRIQVASAESLSLAIDGPFGETLSTTDNLVLHAARTLQEHTGTDLGAHIHLCKELPVASGLGGGSSDAAATLHLLNDLWQTGLSHDTLKALGAPLGADIPMCLHGQACYVSDVGDGITPLPPFPALHAVLINPNVPLSTKDVFERFDTNSPHHTDEKHGESAEDAIPGLTAILNTHHAATGLLTWLRTTRNDLTDAALQLAPAIGEVLAAIDDTNALLCRMSGSGATCFGLYSTKKAAQTAASSLAAQHPEWWVAPTELY